jgi:hypothetical protein
MTVDIESDQQRLRRIRSPQRTELRRLGDAKTLKDVREKGCQLGRRPVEAALGAAAYLRR